MLLHGSLFGSYQTALGATPTGLDSDLHVARENNGRCNQICDLANGDAYSL